MAHNPYAAPRLDEQAPLDAGASGTMPWFAVGTRKLMVMSVLSLGLYTIHWFERQYRFQKRARLETTWPLARAIFSLFFAHELFRRVEGAAARDGVHPPWKSGVMGTLFVASALAGRVLDRAGEKLTTGTVAEALGLLSIATVFGMAYPLVQVQGTVNQLLGRERPEHERNERFTVWNWLVMATGVVVLALVIIGVASPPDGGEVQGDEPALDVVPQ